MVLWMEMLRNVFGLVFSMNWFFFFFTLSDFRRRPSAADSLCPFVFGGSHRGKWIPDSSWDTSQARSCAKETVGSLEGSCQIQTMS